MLKKCICLCSVGLLLTYASLPALGADTERKIPRPTPTTSEALYQAGFPVAPLPDTQGTVSFENLEYRMRESNLSILSCQEQINAQTSFDREKAYKKMLDAINSMADAIWMFNQISNMTDASDPNLPSSYTPADKAYFRLQANNLQSSATSMLDQLETLEPEEYEDFLEQILQQLENAIEQIIVGGENLYINIVTYESQLSELRRTLTSLERKMVEMELRFERGQISQLALQEFKTSYNSTQSKARSLEQSIQNMRSSLQFMLGETPTGIISLEALPVLSNADMEAVSYKSDLEKARAASYTIYQANQTLEDAEEDFDDTKGSYNPNSYTYQMAEHSYQAAILTHDAAIQSFELSFQTLSNAVPDARQALAASKTELAYQQEEYAAAERKYQLGNLSYNGLLDAQDKLQAAEAAVDSANLTLFSAYYAYQRAIERGIVT